MPNKPGMPYSTSKMAVYLTKQIESLKGEKSQREIAAEMGYDKPNIISMFKRGEAKVPLDKIPALAKSLHVDAAHLFRLALNEYWPNKQDVVGEIFGNIATTNEMEIFVKKWRAKTNDNDPPSSEHIEAAVDKILNEIFATK